MKFAKDSERFPWAFKVKDVRYFFNKPIVIDATMRQRLDAFRGRDPGKAWAWFVQATRMLTAASSGLSAVLDAGPSPSPVRCRT